MTWTLPVGVLALENHTNLCGDTSGRCVARRDKAINAAYSKDFPRMLDDALRGLGCKTFAPALLLDHERELNFIGSLDVPQQKAAPTKKLT